MSKLPVLSPKEVLKILKKSGFYVHHQKGSHVQLKHSEDSSLRVTVPYHSNFDLPAPVLKSILKQAKIPEDEFVRLLRKK